MNFGGKKIQRFMEVRDTDKDGLLTRADFELVVQRYKELGASEEQLEKINTCFGKAYTQLGIVDDSTSLTYGEFADRFAKQLDKFKEIIDAMLLGMFDIVDTNNDGKISFQEWVNFYKAIGIDTSYARASFDAMDTNGDGVISKDEFVKYKEYLLTTKDTLHSSELSAQGS